MKEKGYPGIAIYEKHTRPGKCEVCLLGPNWEPLPWEARKGQRDHCCPLHTSGQATLARRQKMLTIF